MKEKHENRARRQSNRQLVSAIAASVERNERVHEKFQNAVVRSLARIEARVRLLQLSEIVDSLRLGMGKPAAEQEAGIEAMVSDLSKELERVMLKKIYREAKCTRQSERGAQNGKICP